MNDKKISLGQNIFQLAMFVVFLLIVSISTYGPEEGWIKFKSGILGMVGCFLVGWIIWRIVTGNWDIRKWSKGLEKQTEEQEMQAKKNLLFFSGKLFFIAAGIVVLIIGTMVGILKLYIYKKTGSWWLQ